MRKLFGNFYSRVALGGWVGVVYVVDFGVSLAVVVVTVFIGYMIVLVQVTCLIEFYLQTQATEKRGVNLMKGTEVIWAIIGGSEEWAKATVDMTELLN